MLFLKVPWCLSIHLYYAYIPFPGLCGNFNDVEADDFKAVNGLIEGTAVTFANTWKTKASCPDVTKQFGDPCSLSVEKGRRQIDSVKRQLILYISFCISLSPIILWVFFLTENYAKHWCSLLSDKKGIFSQCHSEVNPQDYEAVRYENTFL